VRFLIASLLRALTADVHAPRPSARFRAATGLYDDLQPFAALRRFGHEREMRLACRMLGSTRPDVLRNQALLPCDSEAIHDGVDGEMSLTRLIHAAVL
jgi:hypothetical protein